MGGENTSKVVLVSRSVCDFVIQLSFSDVSTYNLTFDHLGGSRIKVLNSVYYFEA